MKQPAAPAYPDISDILQRKAEARKERAALPYGEKVEIVERLRTSGPLRRAREEREAARRK